MSIISDGNCDEAIVVHLPMTRGGAVPLSIIDGELRLENKGYRYSIMFLLPAIGMALFALIVYLTNNSDVALAIKCAALSLFCLAMSLVQYFSFESLIFSASKECVFYERRLAGVAWKRAVVFRNVVVVRVKFVGPSIHKVVQDGFVVIFDDIVFPYCVDQSSQDPRALLECFRGFGWIKIIDTPVNARVANFRIL